MTRLRDAATEFLSQDRIAVVGVSRSSDQPANLIYRTLRSRGKRVFAVNPNAREVEGDPAFPSVGALPEPVDGVVVVTAPDVTEAVVRACVDAGIPRVWMHRSFGKGSVSEDAMRICAQRGVRCIAGGCPMMFVEGADIAHRCMRWILDVTGRLPDPGSPELC